MASINNITGDKIQSKILSKEGRDNWDKIFVKKNKKNKEKNNDKKHIL